MKLSFVPLLSVLCSFVLANEASSTEKGWFSYPEANVIKKMAASSTGVWCITSDGLILYHPDTGKIERFSTKEALTATTIKVAPDGTLWMISDGSLAQFRENEFHTLAVDNGLETVVVLSFVIGHDNAVWAGTNKGLYRYRNGQWDHFDLDFHDVPAVEVDGLGHVWAGTVSDPEYKAVPDASIVLGKKNPDQSDSAYKPSGDPYYTAVIYMYDGSTFNKVKTIGPVPGVASLSLASWKEDRVFAWGVSDPGIAIYYFHDSECTTISSFGGPFIDDITSIGFGSDSSVWVGTSGGITRLTLAPTISTETFTISHGLPSNTILSIASTSDGKLIAGTDTGFGFFDGSKWSDVRLPGPVGSEYTCSVRDSSGAMWFGSEKGISRFKDGDWKTFTQIDGLAGKRITKLWLDSKGRVCYLSTSDDCNGYYDNGKWYSGAEMSSTDTISSDGTAWALKSVNGEYVLYHKVTDTYIKVADYGNVPITQMVAGPDSSVWVCSYYYARKYKNGASKEYTRTDGYPNGAHSVFFSPRGEVWSHSGWDFAKLEGETFKAITLQGHLPYPESFEYAFFDPYNNLWYITDKGIARIDGDKVITYDLMDGRVGRALVDDRGRLFVLSDKKVAWYWENSWHSISNDTGIFPNEDGVFYVDPYTGELWYSRFGALVRYVGEDVLPVEESVRPVSSILCENYPNPFNPETLISYTLPQSGQVTIAIYNATGQKITELARGFHTAGKHTVIWDAKGCASGVYFCSVREGKAAETRKMLLVR